MDGVIGEGQMVGQGWVDEGIGVGGMRDGGTEGWVDRGIGEEGIGSSSHALSSLTCSPTGLRFHCHFK